MRDELSTQELLALIQDIPLLSPKKVVFTGGEPLLRNDILILAHAFKNTDKHPLNLCIITNGTLISREIATNLVEVFDEIRISIDGFQEINDTLRGEGSFEKTIPAFNYIQQAGGDPVASITATSLSIPSLKDFMTYLLQQGITQIHISLVNPAGRAANRQDLLCNKTEVERVAAEFWYETFGLRFHCDKSECLNCGVGKYINIYPDGSVYPCHLLSFPEFCIGNVKQQRLSTIYYHSELMTKLRSLDFREIAQCSECFQVLLQNRACLGRFAQKETFRSELISFVKEK